MNDIRLNNKYSVQHKKYFCPAFNNPVNIKDNNSYYYYNMIRITHLFYTKFMSLHFRCPYPHFRLIADASADNFTAQIFAVEICKILIVDNEVNYIISIPEIKTDSVKCVGNQKKAILGQCPTGKVLEFTI